MITSLLLLLQICFSQPQTSFSPELSAEPDDKQTRNQIGKLALQDINILNNQFLITHISDTSIQSVGTWLQPNKGWYGKIYDVPILFAELNNEGQKLMPNFIQWLIKKEEKWLELPLNPNWPKLEQNQVTSKYQHYNVLSEAKNDPSVSQAAEHLINFILTNFLQLQGNFQRVTNKMNNEETNYWNSKYSQIGSNLPQTDFALDPSLWIECWMNAHRPVEGLNSLSLHQHDFPWHGYILLDTAFTNTTYITPFNHIFFNLKNTNNVMVMLPGGIDHAVLNTLLNPRVSIAFDLVYGLRYHGGLVSHPSVESPQRRLDSGNTWLELLNEHDMKLLEQNNQINWYTLNYKAVTESYRPKEKLEEKSTWGGVVDIRKLLDAIGEKNKAKEDL